MPSPNWVAIRAAYLFNDISVEECAQRFGVSADAIRARCEEEHWDEMRAQRAAIAQIPQHEVATAELPQRLQRVGSRILDILEHALSSNDLDRDKRRQLNLISQCTGIYRNIVTALAGSVQLGRDLGQTIDGQSIIIEQRVLEPIKLPVDDRGRLIK
jgi:hypothetical protein